MAKEEGFAPDQLTVCNSCKYALRGQTRRKQA